MNKLTKFMTKCVDHTGSVDAISKLATFVLISAVLGLLIYGVNQISSLSKLLTVVGIMVVFSFMYCVYETAIARFEETWANNPNTNAIRTWYDAFEKDDPQNIWGGMVP
jgi:hypothetical protein